MGLKYYKSILLLLLVAGLVGINKAASTEEQTTTSGIDTTTSEEPTTTPEIGTTTSEEPTTTPGIDTTTSEEPTTTPEIDTTTSEEPTTTPGIDTTTSEKPTTTPEIDTTTSEEPTTTPGIDTTTSEEPTTTPEIDTTTSEEPTTTPGIDTTTSEKPTTTPGIDTTTTSEEPTTTPGIDTTTSEEPTTTPGIDTTTTSEEPTTTPGIDTTTTSEEPTTTSETTSVSSISTTEQPTTSASDTVTYSSTSSEGTTSDMAGCAPGYFGIPDCTFRCLCLDQTEVCDYRSGHCSSGCPPGRQGPGCNLSVGGDEPVVVVLGLLLTMALLFALVVLALLVRMKRRQAYASSAENYAYEFPEMEPPSMTLADGIERIRETDIQVHTDPVGEGRFGDILPGKIQRGKKRVEVVFKTLKDGSTEVDRNGLMAQLQMYSKLEPHSYVIQFYGVCTVGDQIYAAFEYAANGNLRNFLRRSSMPESETSSVGGINRNETLLINFCLEVCQGMQYLASKKIVHRELMARHIMVDKKNVCKVAGLNATPREEKNYPVRWMAPESLQEKIFNHQSDVWSFGVLMWEVMSLGGQPYPDVSTKDLVGLITGTYRMPSPEDCSLEVFDVMRSCWEEDPQARPTFADLVDKLHIAMAAVDETSIAIDSDSDAMEGLD